VKAPHALQVLLSVPSVHGGTGLFGGAYLDAKAGPAGAVIALSSNNAAVATVPASVTVGSGLTSNTFAIVTHAVTSTKTVMITEVYGGVTKTVVLTVTP
jgi:hypothetical protein